MNHADLGLLTVFPPSNDLGAYIRLDEENMAEERQGGLPSLPARDPRFPQPPISAVPKSDIVDPEHESSIFRSFIQPCMLYVVSP